MAINAAVDNPKIVSPNACFEVQVYANIGRTKLESSLHQQNKALIGRISSCIEDGFTMENVTHS
jgi:hypothetical protein